MNGDYAKFVDELGESPTTSLRRKIHSWTEPTVGDQLYAGHVLRTRIITRTNEGIDVNGSAFVGYSTKGPYYFYPNRGIGASSAERATAAKGRHKKTGGAGKRTPMGIRYDGGYAEAKAAHGVGNVNLFGMEQHTHMLNTLMVKAGGSEMLAADSEFLFDDSGSEFGAFTGSVEVCTELTLGFYGPEAERAKGNNEGNSKLPQREFFALNAMDLQVAESAIGTRMEARAATKRS